MTEAHLNGNGHAPPTAADASKLSKESTALKEQVRAMDEKLAERLKRKPPVRALPPALAESSVGVCVRWSPSPCIAWVPSALPAAQSGRLAAAAPRRRTGCVLPVAPSPRRASRRQSMLLNPPC